VPNSSCSASTVILKLQGEENLSLHCNIDTGVFEEASASFQRDASLSTGDWLPAQCRLRTSGSLARQGAQIKRLIAGTMLLCIAKDRKTMNKSCHSRSSLNLMV